MNGPKPPTPPKTPNPPSKGQPPPPVNAAVPPTPPPRAGTAKPPAPPPVPVKPEERREPLPAPELPLGDLEETPIEDKDLLEFGPPQDIIPKPSGDKEPPPGGMKVRGGLLGNILVDNALLTEVQRDECLAIQGEPGNATRIGEIAIQQGYISKDDLLRSLAAQKRYVHGVRAEQSRVIPLPDELTGMIPVAGPGLDHLLNWLVSAQRHGASDLHVMAGKPLILRHMGKLVQSKDPPLDAAATKQILASALNKEERARLKNNRSIVKCLDLPGGGRARANIFYHLEGVNGTFRLIPSKVPSLVSLNLPPELARFTTYAQGLVLVTGPIGSGKTTTLAALIDIINQERSHHVIVIENPVEFVHENHRSMVTQRQIGKHTASYSAALKAALREDPDVIAIGEMHDLETARLAISAAETGHLVFATLHTENVVRSINRVIDIFPSDEQDQVRSIISESIRGVVSQRLVRRSDVQGRIPVVELLFVTTAMRNLIRDSKIYQLKNMIAISREVGNMLAEDHGKILHEKDLISEETYKQILADQS
ncbi:MAG: PilT/PilU family type 4a pilus ATPase [Deltaproteobacteria bacterium]|nr:PilT/PilU family type 4a pilus ATPase [Deltaproteobacteria bacterium]